MTGRTEKEVINAGLTAKVASMSVDQRIQHMNEIVAFPDGDSEELMLEFAKLVLGPDAEIAEEDSSR